MARSAVLLIAGQCILLHVFLALAKDLTSLLDFSSSVDPPPSRDSGQETATPETCCVTPPTCNNSSRYRSFDGSCNNLLRPTWGMAQTPYGRLLPCRDADDTSPWPMAQSGCDLPNPRRISQKLFSDVHLLDPIWNLNTQQWGQIIAHDMSSGAGQENSADQLICCDSNGQIASDNENPRCAPMTVPKKDLVRLINGTECLSFTRFTTTRDIGCTPSNAAAKAISGVTAYMDLSIVYGNNAEVNGQLRSGSGGRLKTVTRNGREWPPQDPDYKVNCIFTSSSNDPCYLTGDNRANQNTQLTVLQIVMFHEHNRIADALAKCNPHWDDETLFQEARRINIAEFQRINYYEYLPILLGFDNMVKNKLIYPKEKGYVNDYDPDTDPSVLVEHATAALRHFHTLIQGYLKLIAENRKLVDTVRLSNWYFRPSVLELHKSSFDNLVRGLTVQPQGLSDQWWDNEISQFLFRGNNTFGSDLRAIDIQRGRDLDLGNYVAARKACGLSVPSTFTEMKKDILPANVLVLESIYDTVEDVELLVAGSLENNVLGALAGPTFLCIMTEQFYRTRVGDRYFFENGDDPVTAFTPSQLKTIRKASMARLLCDNVVTIEKMQPNAFEQINLLNTLTSCDNLPSVDLTLWKEEEDEEEEEDKKEEEDEKEEDKEEEDCSE